MALKRGSTVGVVAPGFAVKRRPLEAGLARLEGMGYRVRLGRHVLARNGYLAGDDDLRASDLKTMLHDPEVRAIWFARGGYGTARLLDRLPRGLLRRAPKLLIGYSDLTALFAEALKRPGCVCLYGPVVTELGDADAYHSASLRKLLAGRPVELRVARRRIVVPGRARGRLAGGNLTVLSHLCGTRFAPDLRGKVLFLEDAGEPTYRLDRMLTQLRLCGMLNGLAGVLLGGFSIPPRRRFPPDRSAKELFREFFVPLDVPVVEGIPAGHVPRKRTLPLGARVEIDTAAGSVRFTP